MGLTEDLDSFVAILEAALPRIFKGGYQKFITGNYQRIIETFCSYHNYYNISENETSAKIIT